MACRQGMISFAPTSVGVDNESIVFKILELGKAHLKNSRFVETVEISAKSVGTIAIQYLE